MTHSIAELILTDFSFPRNMNCRKMDQLYFATLFAIVLWQCGKVACPGNISPGWQLAFEIHQAASAADPTPDSQ